MRKEDLQIGAKVMYKHYHNMYGIVMDHDDGCYGVNWYNLEGEYNHYTSDPFRIFKSDFKLDKVYHRDKILKELLK